MKRIALVAVVVACSNKSAPAPEPKPADKPAPEKPAPAIGPVTGLDIAGMDRTVKPGDNFFAYANGGWIKSTEIPADRASYGTGAILVELTAKRTAELIQQAGEGAAPNTDARKIGDYYASYMDEAGIEAKGLAPLKPVLDRIAAIKDTTGLARARRDGARRRRRVQQHEPVHAADLRAVGRASTTRTTRSPTSRSTAG